MKKKLLRTGRPPRKRASPKTVNLTALGPLDPQQRYSRAEAAAYLKTSLPSIHKLINAHDLESFREGARTFVTGRSIAAKSLPPT